MSKTIRIETRDDNGCGVTITRDDAGQYVVEGIEEPGVLAVAITLAEAVEVAGLYLVSYAADAVTGYTDWAATTRQGQRMLAEPENFIANTNLDVFLAQEA